MRLGIFAKTFSGNKPLAVLNAARNAGYACVQYNMACSGLGALPLAISAADAKAIAAASHATGVSIAAVSATYNMIDPERERRNLGRQAFSAIASAARDMGTGVVTLCTGSSNAKNQWAHHPDNEGPQAWSDMLREFELLLPQAERHGIILGIEPELANVVSTPEKARRLLDHFKSKHLGIVFDPANLVETDIEQKPTAIIAQAAELLGPDIVLAHAKDRAGNGDFATAGHGVIDWPHFFSTLRFCGFNGDVITHGLAEREAKEVAAFLSQHIAT
jgi:sugar phosphate isomerase/epimerase